MIYLNSMENIMHKHEISLYVVQNINNAEGHTSACGAQEGPGM